MNTYYPQVTSWRQVALFGMFAAMLGTTACAPDAAGPDVVATDVPSFDVQDENLVPNGDYSNPGFLEPYQALWSSLDEDTPNDDTDYVWRIRSGQPPTISAAEVDLTSPVGGTPSPSQAHTLKVRWKVEGNFSTSTPQPTLLNFKVIDPQNGVIANGTSIPTNNNYVTASTSVDSNQITDWNNLRILLSIQLKPSGSSQIEARVTWARLEIR